MSTSQIIGVVLVVVALMDVTLGWVFVGPRIPDPGARRRVMLGIVTGAMLILVLGILFLAGVL